jgi:hypothetical protein
VVPDAETINVAGCAKGGIGYEYYRAFSALG